MARWGSEEGGGDGRVREVVGLGGGGYKDLGDL